MTRFVFTLLLAALCGLVSAGDSWPGFRGVAADGQAQEKGLFSDKAQVGLKVAWKVPLGSGYSGIAVEGNRLYTIYSDGDKDVTGAFDANTGKQLWRHEIGPIYKGHDGSHDGGLSTPAVGHGNVYGVHTFGKFYAVDAGTGKEIWSIDLKEDEGLRPARYGFGAQPLAYGDKVYLSLGGDDKLLAAFNPKTGEKLWSVGSDRVGYPAVVPTEIGGKKQLLVSGMTKLISVDPDNGALLWEFEHAGNNGTIVPVPAGDGQFLLHHKFDGGQLLKVSNDGGNWVTTSAWETRFVRNTYNVPVYHDGIFYAFAVRILNAIDAKTGDIAWRSRQPGDGFTVIADGHLVVATKSGEVSVSKTGGSGFEEVTSVEVFDKTAWALPSVVGDAIYVRGFDAIARINVVDEATGVAVNEDAVVRGSLIPSMLEEVAKASDKQKAVDAFLGKQKQFPIIEGDWVHFIHQADAEDVAVAGDLFGARQEKPMNRVAGTNTFYYSTQVGQDVMAAYLFVENYKDQVRDSRNDRTTSTLLVGADMDFNRTGQPTPMNWFAMPKHKGADYLNLDGEPLGTLEEKKLGDSEATYSVYLPKGYADSDAAFPVTYVLSNQAFGESWQKALDSKSDAYGQTITVFFQPAGRNAAQMFTEQLIPAIEKDYRVAGPANIVGMGFSGGAALDLAMGNTDKFGKVAIQSGFMMMNNIDSWRTRLADVDLSDMAIYVDWGRYDMRNPQEAWDMSQSSPALVEMLKSKGINVRGKEYPQGTDWTSWKHRTGDLLSWMLPKQN